VPTTDELTLAFEELEDAEAQLKVSD